MPVVMNQQNQGAKRLETQKLLERGQAVTGGGLLRDTKVVTGAIAAVLALLVGLVGWSLGWFGGAASAPASVFSPATGKTIGPLAGSDEDNPMGHKRNKSIGE